MRQIENYQNPSQSLFLEDTKFLLVGAADAVAVPTTTLPSTLIVQGAGIDAMTLAVPVAGADDGKVIKIVSNAAFAHTLTAGAGKILAGAAGNTTATFAAQKGASIILMAYQGAWYALATIGITMT